MNQDAAIFVLTNLRERAEKSDSPVVLTSVEVRALQVLFGETVARSPLETSESNAEIQDKGPAELSSRPPLRWKPEQTPKQDLILCLDFGTSFFKASACRTDNPNDLPEFDDVPELIDIAFGENEDGTIRSLLPSELFIHNEILFSAWQRGTSLKLLKLIRTA